MAVFSDMDLAKSAWGLGLKQQPMCLLLFFFVFSDMEWEFNPLEDLA